MNIRYIFIGLCLLVILGCDTPDPAVPLSQPSSSSKKTTPPSDRIRTEYRIIDGKCLEYALFDDTTASFSEEVCMSYCDPNNLYGDLYEALYIPDNGSPYCIEYLFSNDTRFQRIQRWADQDPTYPAIWHCTGDVTEQLEGTFNFNGTLDKLTLTTDIEVLVYDISSPGSGRFTEYHAEAIYELIIKNSCVRI